MIDTVFSIILCGGKGTRMGTRTKHKVCFKIGEKPAILHALERYEKIGIHNHILVIGHMAESVLETVSASFEKCIFVFQREPKGTGDAAKRGAWVLEQLNYDGDVLVVAGDKFIEPRALETLMAAHRGKNADLTFLTNPKSPGSTSGRVFRDPETNRIYNVEFWDIRCALAWAKIAEILAKDLSIDFSTMQDLILEEVPSNSKAMMFFPEIFQNLSLGTPEMFLQRAREKSVIRIGDKSFAPTFVEENSEMVNVSVYLVKAPVLNAALKQIQSDNVQGEEYLTDIINILSSSAKEYRVIPVLTENPTDVMAFNTPEELLEIQEYYQKTLQESEKRDLAALKPLHKWKKYFEVPSSAFLQYLAEIYGNDQGLIAEKCRVFLEIIREYEQLFSPEDEVIIARSPGRVNLMGRHVDHQGADINLVAIHKETMLVASPREDDTFVVHNLINEVYSPFEFRLGDLLDGIGWDDWFAFLNNKDLVETIRDAPGTWSNYVKAAIFRLQFFQPGKKLRGMNCVVHGDIPPAAGLSSSSSLVIAIAEAVVSFNQMEVGVRDFVNICGEGEWFVGTRGGTGDHAAIKCCRPGEIMRVGFFPFEIKEFVSFPPHYALLVINSKIEAKKSSSARDRFNEKVLAYNVGREMLKVKFPEYAPRIVHLRDINPRTLETTQKRIYEMLLTLPESIKIMELPGLLPTKIFSQIREKFPNINLEGEIRLREVVLYGIAETQRSQRCSELMAGEHLPHKFGQVMYISHDGDRVVTFTDRNRQISFKIDYDNENLLRLIEDLGSEDPGRVERAQIINQPGRYACSVPQIDFIVDLAQENKKIFGAQLSGAGLGGCVMMLVEKETAPNILDQILANYREKWNIDAEGFVCTLIGGSGLINPGKDY